MGKRKPKKKVKGDCKRPRNTVTLNLSGTLEEFIKEYELCQSHYRYWILCNAEVRVRYSNRLIYTTPKEGTFYYVIRNEREYATLVIDARQGWMLGFITANGLFQMQVEDLSDLYMDSSHCKLLHFSGSHSEISPQGTGQTRLNFNFLKRCLHILCAYKGPTRYSDPPGFRSSLGLKVILLLEAKFREIFERNCKKMGQDHVSAAEDVHSTQEDPKVSVPSERLLASDLKCLRERRWLSDDLISFIFKSLNLTVNSDQILCVLPSLCYMTYNLELSDAISQMENLDLDTKSLVLFPVNNNEDPSKPDGGTHWSLLVLDQRIQGRRRFTHYDSAAGTNLPYARRLVEKLTPLSTSEVTLQDASAPQQDNGYDCALFLIAIAKEICRWWMSSREEDWEAAVAREVNTGRVVALREDLIQKIEKYMRKSEGP